METWKSKELLIENCEVVAKTNITPAQHHQQQQLCEIRHVDADREQVIKTITGIVNNSRTVIDVETTAHQSAVGDAKRTFQRMEEDKAWIINRRSTSIIWYKNWTNVGITLCICYNLCILLLLVMGYKKFIKN